MVINPKFDSQIQQLLSAKDAITNEVNKLKERYEKDAKQPIKLVSENKERFAFNIGKKKGQALLDANNTLVQLKINMNNFSFTSATLRDHSKEMIGLEEQLQNRVDALKGKVLDILSSYWE